MTDENVTNLKTITEEVSALEAVLPDRIEEVDRLALELAKSQRVIANSEAKLALANSEKAELGYKYVVLQLYMKYNLTAADALKESGEIVRNGAVNPQK